MCVGISRSSRSCGVCVKLRSLLKQHYKRCHPIHSKNLIRTILFRPKQLSLQVRRQTLKDTTKVGIDIGSQTETDIDDADHIERVINRLKTDEVVNDTIELNGMHHTLEMPEMQASTSADGEIEDECTDSQLNEITEIEPEPKARRTIHVRISKYMEMPAPTDDRSLQSDDIKEEKLHACNVCHKTFKFLKTLRRHHVRMHDVSNDDSDYVQPNVSRKSTLKSSKVQKEFNCAKCEEVYSTRRDLMKHCKYDHTDDVTPTTDSASPTKNKEKVPKREYPCESCGEIFKRESMYTKHMRKHTGEKPFLCDTCGAAYASVSALNTHKKEHSGQNLFPCNLCDKVFATKTRLLVHARTHSGEKPFSCEYCGRRFSNISGLKPHLRLHTGEKPFKCTLCDYASTVKAGLRQHMVNHGEVVIYSCHLCDKKFRFKAKHKAHLLMHTGERRHFCPICNRGFFYANEVKKHIGTVHSQARPYKCDFCDQTYKRKTHVTRHMQNAHKVNVLPPAKNEVHDIKFDLNVPVTTTDVYKHQLAISLPVTMTHTAATEQTITVPPHDLQQQQQHHQQQQQVIVLGDQTYELPSIGNLQKEDHKTLMQQPNMTTLTAAAPQIAVINPDGYVSYHHQPQQQQQHQSVVEQPQNLSQQKSQRFAYLGTHKLESVPAKQDGEIEYDNGAVNAEWYAAALANAVHYSQIGM